MRSYDITASYADGSGLYETTIEAETAEEACIEAQVECITSNTRGEHPTEGRLRSALKDRDCDWDWDVLEPYSAYRICIHDVRIAKDRSEIEEKCEALARLGREMIHGGHSTDGVSRREEGRLVLWAVEVIRGAK